MILAEIDIPIIREQIADAPHTRDQQIYDYSPFRCPGSRLTVDWFSGGTKAIVAAGPGAGW